MKMARWAAATISTDNENGCHRSRDLLCHGSHSSLRRPTQKCYRIGTRHAAILMTLVLLSSACSGEHSQSVGREGVPISTWVRGLCVALQQFKHETERMSHDPTVAESLTRLASALQQLKLRVKGLGVPADDGGRIVAEEIVERLDASLEAAQNAKEQAGSRPDVSDIVPVGPDLAKTAEPALVFPLALTFLLSPSNDASTTIDVYLRNSISREERDSLTRFILSVRGVRSVKYESQADACARFRLVHANQPEIARNVDCSVFSPRLQLTLTSEISAAELQRDVDTQAGVEKVVPETSIETLAVSAAGLDSSTVRRIESLRTEAERHATCILLAG